MPSVQSSPKKRVLVVDDESEVTYALQAYFLVKGYEMLTALDGISAMRILRQYLIDLVLLDMKMPGVNGLEVLKFIHAQSPKTRVIVVTAYDDQFQEMVEKLGADGFLMKPFGIGALTTVIEDVLAGRHATPLFHSEAVSPTVGGATPKARLLFVEPSEYTYQLKEVFFSTPEKCGGSYQVAPAYSAQEALEQMSAFRPDIVLVDLALLGSASDLAAKAMVSESRPKELIIHGSGTALPTAQTATVEDLSRHGVKVVYNESFTRAGMIRLGEAIRKAALAHDLVEGRR